MKFVFKLNFGHTWPTNPDPCWKALWKCKIHEALKTLVWRIGSATLPTNLNMFSRISKGSPLCPLCGVDAESAPHLFFRCKATKLFWFRTSWGIRADLLPVFNDIDIVKMVVNPPVPPMDHPNSRLVSCQASVQFALILEAIWNFRNHHVHLNREDNPLVQLKTLELKVAEHWKALPSLVDSVSLKNYCWATWVFNSVVIPLPKKSYPSMRVWVQSLGFSKYTCV